MGAAWSIDSKINLFFGLLTRAMQRALRLLLGDQADDEIVFVVAGVGHDDVGASESGGFEDDRIAAVADHRHVAVEQRRHHLGLAGLLLDDDDFVVLRQQPARQIRADLAAADDDDEHRCYAESLIGNVLRSVAAKRAKKSDSASGATIALISSPARKHVVG